MFLQICAAVQVIGGEETFCAISFDKLIPSSDLGWDQLTELGFWRRDGFSCVLWMSKILGKGRKGSFKQMCGMVTQKDKRLATENKCLLEFVFCFFYCCNTMDEWLRNMCNLRRRNLHTHRIVNEGAQNLRHLKHRLLWRWQTGRLVVHNRIACSIYRGGRSLSETRDASKQLRMFSIHPSRGNVYSNCEIYQSNQYTITW